jgi:hypothetical protein
MRMETPTAENAGAAMAADVSASAAINFFMNVS